MADFGFSEDVELQKLNALVKEEPEEFEHWEKLVRAAEAQEGGLSRNSSPGAIAATREVYDEFLKRFPLFFGYWKKYADLEFSIAGTEAAEMVYERGVASISSSVDLWHNYCGFKVETSHDVDVNRELFERAAENVGLDFLAHPFWDKYMEYEERQEASDRVFAILGRIIHIPMHQYARYFERYRTMAASRPLAELAPEHLLTQLRQDQEIAREPGLKHKSERDLENDTRAKLDEMHVEAFQRTQAETNKRWTYESEIKRPYFHVTELDDQQLANWRKYLDFEEDEGDYVRIRFLYERCLVTAANYEEFWLRYARWTLAQAGKQEEVRNIYQRASCLFVPIANPTIRLFYAQFEESQSRSDVAIDVYEAVLEKLPNHIETIISLVNVHRRERGTESAVGVVKKYLEDPNGTTHTRGALVTEWARLEWKTKGEAAAARGIYLSNEQRCLDSPAFWTSWLALETQQPTSEKDEREAYDRVKAVFEAIRQKAQLPPELVVDLSSMYFAYLKERGGRNAMKELMDLDVQINGSIGAVNAAGGKATMGEFTTRKQPMLENGRTGAGSSDVPMQDGVQSYSIQTGIPIHGGQVVT